MEYPTIDLRPSFNCHVLLVDDDSHFRRSMALGLQMEGYQVFEAGSGLEALDFLQSQQLAGHEIHVAVLDARMPGPDGFHIANRIREAYPAIRVIILSAHANENPQLDYPFLNKPVHLSSLTCFFNQDN